MESVTTTDCSPLGEAVVFLSYFKDLPGPAASAARSSIRSTRCCCCVCSRCWPGPRPSSTSLASATRSSIFFAGFGPYCDGTPSHDHLGDIFATLDAEQFQRCFVAWVAAMTGMPSGVVAIDGKTSRRSYQKKGGKAPIHMVSAFAARQRLVLGQVKVAEKSNEIIAIPKLLDMLAIEGAIVTIDAMGCQRDIAQKIIDKKADYVACPEGQSGLAARGCRSLRRRAESQGFQRHHGQAGPRQSMLITAASRPEPPPSSTTSPGCRNVTIGPA